MLRLQGTTKNRFTKMNRPPEGTSWLWLTADILESAAWRALPGNAMKVVLRIGLEHLKHGGVENGNLPVTYQDFVRWGVRRNSIHEAQLVAIHLGLVDRTSIGEVPWRGDIRRPSTFGLTWLPQHNGIPPSNRWTRIRTDLDAKQAIGHAKAQLAQVRRRTPSWKRARKQSPTPKDVTWPGNDTATWPGSDSVPRQSNTAGFPSNEAATPFYMSGYPDDSPNRGVAQTSRTEPANDRQETADAAVNSTKPTTSTTSSQRTRPATQRERRRSPKPSPREDGENE
jgi:hypothetical protein